jgi:hypothetical protein
LKRMGERDASTKGQSIREGNSGGRPSKYKPEYAETASKLCARLGFTDEQLADWFEIGIRTLHEWKLKHPDFAEALKVGKAETDDLVERATVAHIQGYYVLVDEMDRFGNVKKLRKWIPGNAHAGIKWLNCRRPEVYREQKEKKHILSMDDAFLRFLDQMDEKAKRERELNAPRGQQLIDDKQIVEAEIVPIQPDEPLHVAHQEDVETAQADEFPHLIHARTHRHSMQRSSRGPASDVSSDARAKPMVEIQ